MTGRLAGIAAIAGAALALAATACGGDRVTETGGLATTTSSTAAERPPPPEGPLDPLVDEQIGPLTLESHTGAAAVRQTGAEDARTLDYVAGDGSEALVTLGRFPSRELAKAYASQYAAVLVSDQGFDPRGKPKPFDGASGPGNLLELENGKGIRAAVWTTGPVFAAALSDRMTLATVLDSASFGENR